MTFNTNVFGITVSNTETIKAAANFDNITIVNSATGNTTITAGMGADVVTASAGQDNFRFTSTADSAAADTIYNFDAGHDTFTWSGIDIAGRHIEFVDDGALVGSGQASAHLQNFGPGNDLLQIDTDGDGLSNMDISLQNLQDTLHNSNFLLT